MKKTAGIKIHRHIILFGLYVLLLLAICACSKEPIKNTISSSELSKDMEVEIIEVEPNDTMVEVPPIEHHNLCSLTGLPLAENMPLNRAVVVMLDNHFGARPQAGISKADHVYEMLAEGRITRYMAVFYSKVPDTVGPIRSARPYFISKALEYDPYYVHVGGSMQALTDIINLKMGDIDGLSSGGNVFWRKKHKKIPHNMYSSIEAIQQEGKRRSHREKVEIQPWDFKSDKYTDTNDVSEHSDDINTNPYRLDDSSNFSVSDEMKINNVFSNSTSDDVKAKVLMIRYKNKTAHDKLGYFITYQYNFKNRVYDRFVNGMRQFDEIDNISNENIPDKGISAKNIIVQIAKHRVIDNEGRRKVDLIGSGTGYYLVNGKAYEIIWEKQSRRDRTIYRYKNGDKLQFEAGNIWFQIVENDENIHLLNP